MRVMMTHHEIASSSQNRIEIDTNRVTITHAGEIYVISQSPDGILRIETPGGELHLDAVSPDACLAHITARGSCLACASRVTQGLKGPCEAHEAARPKPAADQKAANRQGPRIVKSPKPQRVRCSECKSTIEYEPEDLFRMASIPGSDDVGPMAVRCPKPRCVGRGYPR